VPPGLLSERCYWAAHGKPPCGPVEFWWRLPREAPGLTHRWTWLGLCARCCAVMRKHEVSAERITNTCPANEAVCYADDIIIHYEPEAP